MNPYANEIVIIGKKNGSTAAGMLGWLLMPNFYLDNKTPYDLLHNDHTNVEKEFDRVLNALNKNYFKNTGNGLKHHIKDERSGLHRFLKV